LAYSGNIGDGMLVIFIRGVQWGDTLTIQEMGSENNGFNPVLAICIEKMMFDCFFLCRIFGQTHLLNRWLDVAGWWYTYPSEKYEFVSWDDYSQYDGKNKIHVPNHQPGRVGYKEGK